MIRGVTIAAGLVLVLGCGAQYSEETAARSTATPSVPIAIVSLPSTTTTLNEQRAPVDPLPDVGDPGLAPAGAYPVVDLPTDDLEKLPPGTYRYRLTYQADWPEECLEEFVVLPRYEEAVAPVPLPSEELRLVDSGAVQRYLDASRAAMDRRVESQRPICEQFWADSPAMTSDADPAPQLPPEFTLPASTTTTIP